MKKEPVILESPDLVAFITLQTKKNPRPFKREYDGRVVFEFIDDVSKTVEDFYKNIPVDFFCL